MSLAGSNNQQNQNKKYLPKNESFFNFIFELSFAFCNPNGYF